jgi:hypothetical protein
LITLNFVLIKVVARGIVVLSEQIPMSSEAPQTSATLTFTATNQMAPKSRLVIYAIRAKNKEVRRIIKGDMDFLF